jgi:hypothetical protein
MRALPSERAITVANLPPFASDICAKFGGRLKRVAGLPSGDALYVVDQEDVAHSFSLGGSQRFAGRAVVLGRRSSFGEYKDARSRLEAIAAITDFKSDKADN